MVQYAGTALYTRRQILFFFRVYVCELNPFVSENTREFLYFIF